MPTELEEVLYPSPMLLQRLLTLLMLPARRVSPSWQYSNTADRCDLQTTSPSSNNGTHSFLAAENLLPYSKTQPVIFKVAQLRPVKDLKLLVKDYAVRPLLADDLAL